MAQNFIESGEVKDHVLTADTTSGSLVTIGDMVGVALGSGKTGETVAVGFEGVFEVAKATGSAITLGQKVYVADGAIVPTDNSGANKWVGYAWTAALSAATTVQVRLACC